MDIFAEPSYRQPRGKSFIGYAVCGDLENGSRKTFKTEREAVEFRNEMQKAGRSVVHGFIEIRHGEVWVWGPK